MSPIFLNTFNHNDMAELCSNICITGGINGICESGKGGIVQVAITNWANDLFTIYDDTDSSSLKPQSRKKYVTAPITGGVCGTTNGWYKFTFKRNTGSMSSTLNVDETNGISFVQTDLNMIFSRMEQEKRLDIVSLCQSPCGVIVKDANGQYWAMGVYEPVYVSAGEGVTGTNRTDANQYSVTLTDYSHEFPFPVKAELAEQIFAAAKL